MASRTALEDKRDELAYFGLDIEEIDITRGNPSKEQEALSKSMLFNTETQIEGIDCANYGGGLEGIPPARRLFSEIFEVDWREVMVLGNSSLQIMHDLYVQSSLRGVCGHRWPMHPIVLFLEPAYDRHIAIAKRYGATCVGIPLLEDGPDMEVLTKWLRNPNVVLLFCVPKYSNPTAITYADEKVRQLAALPAAFEGFRVVWDMAYVVHDLSEESVRLLNFMDECKKAGNPDRYFAVASFSKVTLAGAAIAAVTMSDNNKKWFLESLSVQTIGYDKLNQLRHVRFLPDLAAVKAHMKKHRAIIAPKFNAVYAALEERFAGSNLVTWTKAKGGYFIFVQMPAGCALQARDIAASLGVKVTDPRGMFVDGNFKDDCLRIAPTMLPLEKVKEAAHIIALSIEASISELNS